MCLALFSIKAKVNAEVPPIWADAAIAVIRMGATRASRTGYVRRTYSIRAAHQLRTCGAPTPTCGAPTPYVRRTWLQNLHTHTRTTHETHHAHTKHVPNTHTCTHSPKPHACNTRPHTHTHGANLTKQPNRHCSKRGERRSHAIRERDGSDRQRRQRRHSGVRGGTLPGQHVSGVRDAPPMPQHGLSEPAPHRVCHSHADSHCGAPGGSLDLEKAGFVRNKYSCAAPRLGFP